MVTLSLNYKFLDFSLSTMSLVFLFLASLLARQNKNILQLICLLSGHLWHGLWSPGLCPLWQWAGLTKKPFPNIEIFIHTLFCQDAIQLSLGSFYPNLLLSGIIWPLEGMPDYLRSELEQYHMIDANRLVVYRDKPVNFNSDDQLDLRDTKELRAGTWTMYSHFRPRGWMVAHKILVTDQIHLSLLSRACHYCQV